MIDGYLIGGRWDYVSIGLTTTSYYTVVILQHTALSEYFFTFLYTLPF